MTLTLFVLAFLGLQILGYIAGFCTGYGLRLFERAPLPRSRSLERLSNGILARWARQ